MAFPLLYNDSLKNFFFQGAMTQLNKKKICSTLKIQKVKYHRTSTVCVNILSHLATCHLMFPLVLVQPLPGDIIMRFHFPEVS